MEGQDEPVKIMLELKDLGADIERLSMGHFSRIFVYPIKEEVYLGELFVLTPFPYLPVILLQYNQEK